jgi:DNA-binding NarL/FixJ family response regulator
VRVVVGEDSVLLREGIVRVLGQAGFEVVAQAGDADELVRKVSAHKPDFAPQWRSAAGCRRPG